MIRPNMIIRTFTIFLILIFTLIFLTGDCKGDTFEDGKEEDGKAYVIGVGILLGMLNTLGQYGLFLSYVPLKGKIAREGIHGSRKIEYSSLEKLDDTFCSIPFIFFSFGVLFFFITPIIYMIDPGDYPPIFFILFQAGFLFIIFPSAHFIDGFELTDFYISRPVTVINKMRSREIIELKSIVEVLIDEKNIIVKDIYGNREKYDFKKDETDIFQKILKTIKRGAGPSCRIFDTRNQKIFDYNRISLITIPPISKDESSYSYNRLKRMRPWCEIVSFSIGVFLISIAFSSLFTYIGPVILWVSIVGSVKFIMLGLMMYLFRMKEIEESKRILYWALKQKEKGGRTILPTSESRIRILLKKKLRREFIQKNKEHFKEEYGKYGKIVITIFLILLSINIILSVIISLYISREGYGLNLVLGTFLVSFFVQIFLSALAISSIWKNLEERIISKHLMK